MDTCQRASAQSVGERRSDSDSPATHRFSLSEREADLGDRLDRTEPADPFEVRLKSRIGGSEL